MNLCHAEIRIKGRVGDPHVWPVSLSGPRWDVLLTQGILNMVLAMLLAFCK